MLLLSMGQSGTKGVLIHVCLDFRFRMPSCGLAAVVLLAGSLTFVTAQSSCKGRCGMGYYRGNMCQCDYSCLGYGECCRDYESVCTTKDSCKGRCGETFKRGRLCNCDPDCVKYNQCCEDYKDHCDEPDPSPEATEQPIEDPLTLSEGNDPDDTFFPTVNPTSYLQDDPDSASQLIFQTSPLPEGSRSSPPTDLQEDLTTRPPLPDLDGFEIPPEQGTDSAEKTTALPEVETTPGPSTALPEVETTPGPSTALPEVETTPVPTTALPEVETTPVPTTALPEVETTPGSTTALPEVETTPGPSTALPEVETTPGPSIEFPEVETTPGPSIEFPEVETTPGSTTAGPSTAEPTTGSTDDSNDTNLCSGRPISGVTTLSNGTVVVFRGHYFWVLDRNRVPGPARGITQVWGVPSPIDTVFTRCNCQGKTYIFKGPQYWRYENDALEQGYPKVVQVGFDGLRGHITAALSVPQYGQRKEAVYFFKRGGTVQKYAYQYGTNPSCRRKVHHAVYTHGNRIARQISVQVSHLEPAISYRTTWKGFPTTITAAVSIPNKREPEGYNYYVFSRSKSYRVRMDGERPVVAASKSNTSSQTNEVFRCPKKTSRTQ
uniref:Proteoglycan 4b n=1 Tax=Neogobius melanostomus TaxID=47308 RepID=A0A8C6UWY6_9GOBI